MRLLLVEDELRLAEALCEILRLENYDVDHFVCGTDGFAAIKNRIYDIIILDVMLPQLDGFSIARNTRQLGIKTPILMLTARSGLDDKVAGLDCGADDYLTKPFMTKELLARLRALGRRALNTTEDRLSFGDLTLDTSTMTLICAKSSEAIRLSEKEYKILEYLMANGGRILTREQLAAKIWGFDCDAEYNNVEVYMSFTRKKLSFIGSETEIKAVRGVGYELRYDNVQNI